MSEVKNLVIQAKVKPNSQKFKIEFKDQFIIHCKSLPEKNKANLEIIKELEKKLKTKVEIIRGLKSKNKSILIHNITQDELKRMI